MKYLVVAVALLLSGCVSTASRDLPNPVMYTLDKEISWTWDPPLTEEQTIVFQPGTYIAKRRDKEGYYLVPPDGTYEVRVNGKLLEKRLGGIYLPDDHTKGPAFFIYDPGMTTAINGIVMMKPASDKMIRVSVWGPSALISEFKKNE